MLRRSLPRSHLSRVVAALAVGALGLAVGVSVPRSVRAQSQTLAGEVGPGFTIVLRDGGGGVVSELEAGTYTIAVDDRSNMHNFHLTGPGVDERTGVGFVGQATWTVTFSAGQAYTYVCDPHPAEMRGSFGVVARSTTTTTGESTTTAPTTTGATTSPPPPPSPPPAPPPTTTSASVSTTAPATTAAATTVAREPSAVRALTATALRVRLAVAKTRARRVQVDFRLNRAARARLRLLRGRALVASASSRARAGRNSLRLAVPRGARPALYRLRLELTGSDGARRVLTRTLHIGH